MLPPSATPYTRQPVYPLIRSHDWRAGGCGRSQCQAEKYRSSAHGDDQPIDETRDERRTVCGRHARRNLTRNARRDARRNIRRSESGGVRGLPNGLADAQAEVQRNHQAHAPNDAADHPGSEQGARSALVPSFTTELHD